MSTSTYDERRAPLATVDPIPSVGTHTHRRISWAAIFGGVILIVAIQLLLSLLGAGIGLGTVDTNAGSTPSPSSLGLGAGIWWVVSSCIALVAGGYVESLSHPGGNVTGFMNFDYDLSGKWLELIQQIAPSVTRAAVIRDATSAAGVGQFSAVLLAFAGAMYGLVLTDDLVVLVVALGVTAGIGTLLLLLLNGVSLGGVFGLYASKGILSLLLAFVAPHGVLELSAICIAGGGGSFNQLNGLFTVPAVWITRASDGGGHDSSGRASDHVPSIMLTPLGLAHLP